MIDKKLVCLVWFMVFSATCNTISAISISWQLVLLVAETGVPEKTTDLSQVTDKLYHMMLYTSPWSGFEPTTSAVIGTGCIGSFKSNYRTFMTTTTPQKLKSDMKNLITVHFQRVFLFMHIVITFIWQFCRISTYHPKQVYR